jgi:hypothetical protein
MRKWALVSVVIFVVWGCGAQPEHRLEGSDEADVQLTTRSSAPPASAGASVFTAVADAFVRSGSPRRNYGDRAVLRVREAHSSYRSYLRFEVRGIASPVISARLRLYVLNGSPDGGAVAVSQRDWAEDEISWRTAPDSADVLATLGPVRAGNWVDVDVGSVVRGAGDFGFSMTSQSADSAFYSSREGLAPPVLVIETEKANDDAGAAAGREGGVAVADAGMAVADAGMAVADAGMAVADAGMPVADQSVAVADAGMPVADAGPVVGRVYYVSSSTGSDTNPGTAGSPWRTIAKVNRTRFDPGDQVLFRRGDRWSEKLVPSSSGAVEKPIVFGAYGTGERPTIAGSRSMSCIGWTQQRSYLIFRYLRLAGCQIGFNIWSDQGTSHHLVLEHSLIEDAPEINIYFTGVRSLIIRHNTIRNAVNEHGIYVDGTLGAEDILIEHNEIYGNPAMCVQYNSNGHHQILDAVLRYNRMHDCGFGAVNNIGALKLRAHHNLIYGDMPAGFYNTCDAAALRACAEGGLYHHNTIVVGGDDWSHCISGDYAEFKNNICVHQAAGGLPIYIESPTSVSDYNLYYGTETFSSFDRWYFSLDAFRSAGGTDRNSRFADPLFVDAAGADFRLQPGSPAIDAAAALGYTVDFDGKPRMAGSGVDIGALER